jgi:hypothetical protein
MKQYSSGSCGFASSTNIATGSNCLAVEQPIAGSGGGGSGGSGGSGGAGGSGGGGATGGFGAYVMWEPTQMFANDCMAMVGAPDLTPAAWERSFLGCPLEVDGETQAEDVCATNPASGFDSVVCVATPGTFTCPQEGYTERALYHADLVDNRACEDNCGCDASAMQCTGTVTLHSATACGVGGTTEALSPNSCQQTLAQSVTYVPEVTGQCVTGTATPIGDVTAASPYTVCCTPSE